jgi:hypothetical protein
VTVEADSALVVSRWTRWLAGLGRESIGGTVEPHLRGLKHAAEAAASDVRRVRPGTAD